MASPATTSRPGMMPTPAEVADGAAAAAAAATKALSSQPAAENDAEAAPANDENKQSIASIFAEGSKNIDTSRTDNLFQALEERPLTDAERAIIDARVAMQRKMYALFEKRETARKAEALIELCPELRPCEAEMALEFCKGSEAAAAERLTGDWTFVRRVRQACGTTAPAPVPVAAEEGGAAGAGGAGTSLRNDYNRHLPAANAPRPKKIELSALGNGVFIGSFRGRAAALGPHNLASKKSDGGAGDEENNEGGGEPAARAPSAEPSGAAARKRAASAGAGPSRSRSVSVAPADAGQGQQQAAMTTRRPRSASAAVPDAAAASAAASAAAVKAGGVKHRLVKRLADGSVVEVSPEEARAALENTSSSAAARSDLASLGALVVEALLAAPLPSSASASASSAAAPSAASFLLAMPSEALRSAALAAAGARDAERCAALVAAAGAQRQLREQKQEAKLKRQQRAARIAAEEAAGAAATAPVAAPPSSAEEPMAADEGAAAAAPSEEAAAPVAAADPAAAAPKRKASAPSTRKKAGSKWAAAEEHEEDGIEEGGGGEGGGAAVEATTVAATAEEKGEAADDAPAPEALAPEEAEAAPVEAAPPSTAEAAAAEEAAAPANPSVPSAPSTIPANAISRNGHTNRGRVRQKSSKQAQLMSVGEPVFEENASRHKSQGLGWHNAGYIFPAGFVSRVAFRSSVSLDQVCIHECRVVGRGGLHWPAPTFEVVAMDRPDEPLVAKSCTGCWTAVLRRINAEITARIAAGEDLPPPPKTAIAGPEYFGFCQPEIADAIEGLDPEHRCALYWAGKEERIAAMAGLPPPSYAAAGEGPSAAPRAPRVPRGGHARAHAAAGGLARKGARRRRSADSDDDEDRRRREDNEEEEEEDPEARIGNRWSGVSRAERYRKRARNTSGDGGGNDDDGAENGEDPDDDPDNPLPGLIDPITLAPVRDPAIAPSGHVCGMATWKAVLRPRACGGSSVCPFTKKPLSWEQCVRLTHNNVERYRDRIRT